MKLVIFDLDGTLLDTVSDLADSVNYAMGMLGLPVYTVGQVAAMVGSGMTVTLTRALGKSNIDKLPQAKEMQAEYYGQHCNDKTRPFDGIIPLLKKLKKDGVGICVYSNKDQSFAEATCKAQFGSLVDYVVGTAADGVTKPDATRLLQLVERIGVDNCVYCGDSDVDVQTAKNASMPCVSVTWGYRDKAQLAAAGANMFADNCDELYSWVCRLLG